MNGVFFSHNSVIGDPFWADPKEATGFDIWYVETCSSPKLLVKWLHSTNQQRQSCISLALVFQTWKYSGQNGNNSSFTALNPLGRNLLAKFETLAVASPKTRLGKKFTLRPASYFLGDLISWPDLSPETFRLLLPCWRRWEISWKKSKHTRDQTGDKTSEPDQNTGWSRKKE